MASEPLTMSRHGLERLGSESLGSESLGVRWTEYKPDGWKGEVMLIGFTKGAKLNGIY